MKNQKTLVEQLRARAETTPSKIAYVFIRDDGQIDQITFKELCTESRSLAAALLDYARPGARALLLYPSGLEFIKAFLACLYAGIVAVPAALARKPHPSQRLTAILRDADPALVLTTGDCISAVKSGCFPEDLIGRECIATDTVRLGASLKRLPEIDNDSIAFLQYTSGSIEIPKGVIITHGNIVSNVLAIRRAFAFSENSVMVGWLPLFHDMGLIGNVVSPLYVGFKSVLMAPAAFLKNPLVWLQAISKYRGTCAGAPNFGWNYCVSRITEAQKKGLDLSSLKIAYNGAEPIRAETLEQLYAAFSSCGLRREALFPCYGMAEATLLISGGLVRQSPVVLSVSKAALEGNQVRQIVAGREEARQLVSCGRIAEGFSLVVVDPETGLPCSRRQVGEIWISGESVGKGYWNRPSETNKTFRAYLADSGDGPYLRTGDLGFLQDGELFITGRLKDLVIINGRNIYPQDIEQIIEHSIDFIEPNMCAAFSVEVDGQERLAIVAEANRALLRAAQIERKRLDKEEQPVRTRTGYLAEIDRIANDICKLIFEQLDVPVSTIVFVRPGTFPRTSSGKVQRIKCRQLALEGKLDIVYVTSGSIFDRREIRDRRESVGSDETQGAPSLEMVSPESLGSQKQIVLGPNVEADARETADQSRAKADAMIEWFRDYAGRRLNSRLIDERRTVPPYVVLDLGNNGFFGLQVPRHLGGCGLTTVDLLRVMEQLAGVDLTLAMLVGIHNGLGLRPILAFGSESLRHTLLPDLAAGRQLAAFAMTEPGAGSNPLAMSAAAVRTHGGWLVNAEKQWIGLGSWAGVLTVFARAHDTSGTALGTIALTVPENALGLSQGPEALTMGVRGIVQNTIYLKDVFVPDSAVIGNVGDGMAVGQDAMMFSRLGIAAMCIGAMKRCAQLIVRYTGNRRVSTGLLLDNVVTLTRLADLTCAIDATESLIYEIAALLDSGATVPAEAYIACKTAAPEFLAESADHLVQLLGGRGYIETNAAPQILRDARVLRILEGPTETLNMHLGANAMRRNNAIVELIANTLGSPSIVAELLDAIAELEAAANGMYPAASDETLFDQWLQYHSGRLTTAAIILATARKRLSGSVEDRKGVQRTIDWARSRFLEIRRHAMVGLSSFRQEITSDKLCTEIARYEVAIGNVDQQMSGEDHVPDRLLRCDSGGSRVSVSENREGAPVFSLGPQSDTAGEAEHAPLGVIRQTTGGECAETRAALKQIDAAGLEKPGAGAARQMLHDCMLEWLRVEKKRTRKKIDYNLPFVSLGMDSLGAMSLTLEIERKMGVSLNPEVLYECSTINELALHIDERFMDRVNNGVASVDTAR